MLQYKSPLKRWLDKHKMTYSELAMRIGVSQNMVTRYVAGTSMPTGARLDALVKLTGMTPEQLEAGRYRPAI